LTERGKRIFLIAEATQEAIASLPHGAVHVTARVAPSGEMSHRITKVPSVPPPLSAHAKRESRRALNASAT
jgi:hypothetical protein